MKEEKQIFEDGAWLFGAKRFAEMMGMTRATLLNYRKGRTQKIPHLMVVKAMRLIGNKTKENSDKMYNVKQNGV